MHAEYLSPAVTPFDDHGEVDVDAAKRHIDRILAAGIDGILLLGSSGEFFAMTDAQRRAFTEQIADHLAGRTKLLVGTGFNSADETVSASKHALDAGASGVMVIAPYYFELSRPALEDHFLRVADAVDGEVHLYNYPARTGNDIDAAMVVRLLQRAPNIVGIKDTVGDMAHTRAIIDAALAIRPGFQVYSGMDENFAHNVLAGGSGCIAALSNVRPDIVAAWVRAVREGDAEGIAAGQRVVDVLSGLYGITPQFVQTVKEAAVQAGAALTTQCRFARLPLSDEQKAAVAAILQKADAAFAGSALSRR